MLGVFVEPLSRRSSSANDDAGGLLACYRKSDPCVMRVLLALRGKEILDAEEAT
jgi:hypothetical protein